MSRRICFFRILVTTILLIESFFLINVSATEFDTENNFEILYEENLPDVLNFKVSDECSHHNFFKQATAYADGSFATCTSGIVVDEVRTNPNQKFVDIYDANGRFIKELNFETSSSIAIELTKTTLNIYLYSEIICYNLETEDVKYYITPQYETYNSGYVKSLRKNKFTVGEWTYYCKGGNFLGHTQLIRTNGNLTHTLIEMEGTQNPNIIHALIGAAIIASGSVVLLYIKRKNKKFRNNT